MFYIPILRCQHGEDIPLLGRQAYRVELGCNLATKLDQEAVLRMHFTQSPQNCKGITEKRLSGLTDILGDLQDRHFNWPTHPMDPMHLWRSLCPCPWALSACLDLPRASSWIRCDKFFASSLLLFPLLFRAIKHDNI